MYEINKIKNTIIKGDTIDILKIQPNNSKGYSYRRTLKTLQQAKKDAAVLEFRNQLINARTEVDGIVDRKGKNPNYRSLPQEPGGNEKNR